MRIEQRIGRVGQDAYRFAVVHLKILINDGCFRVKRHGFIRDRHSANRIVVAKLKVLASSHRNTHPHNQFVGTC